MIYKRIWLLGITIGSVIKYYKETYYDENSLKIEFNVTAKAAGAYPKGNITIYGLNKEDLQYYAILNQKRGFANNIVTLECGYMGQSLSLLFQGNIQNAKVDFQSVDKSLNLELGTMVSNNFINKRISSSYVGTKSVKDVASDIAKENGVGLQIGSNVNETLQDFSFIGTPYQFVESLRESFPNLDIFFSPNSNKIIIEKQDETIDTDTLSKDTGLFGAPEAIQNGLIVHSLLNLRLKVGQRIKLKYENITHFNGAYKIMEITHRGSNKSNEWVTILTLRNI
ncbi:baseplate hub protein [Helicobacter ganmani]|uniref:baseplate hub protein n=1 Tax=Helicobacter ganmani TaxID=60246 RepID=UPI003A874CB7